MLCSIGFSIEELEGQFNTQILIDSRIGYAFYYKNGRLVQKQSLIDEEYRKAVRESKLDIFWNAPELKVDRSLTIPVPVKITGFRNLNGTAENFREAGFREWAAYFAGQLYSDCLPFKSYHFFNTAIVKDKFDLEPSDIPFKATIDRGGSIELKRKRNRENLKHASLTDTKAWLKKFMKLEMMLWGSYRNGLSFVALEPGETIPSGSQYSGAEFLTSSAGVQVLTKNLLLGNGIVARCKVSGGSTTVNIFGTHGQQVYLSNWGRVYKGVMPKFGDFRFYNTLCLITPTRDELGKAVTGLEKSIAGGEAMPVLGEVEEKVEIPSVPVVTAKQIFANPQSFNGKQVLIIDKIDNTFTADVVIDDLEVKLKTGHVIIAKGQSTIANRNFYYEESELKKVREYLILGTVVHEPNRHELKKHQVRVLEAVILDFYK